MLIRKKLKAVLISLADAAHNDSDTGVLDTLMYEHFKNVPRTEVNDYLYELGVWVDRDFPESFRGRLWISEYNKKRIAASARSASQIGYE
jgi:hypothetical protein